MTFKLKPSYVMYSIGCVALIALVANWIISYTGENEDAFVRIVYAQEPSLTTNPGFEQGGNPAEGWTRDEQRTAGKGQIMRDLERKRSGMASIKLVPSGGNVAKDPLAITQIIPADKYRGKTVEFSGYLLSEPGTQGILGMLSLVKGRVKQMEMLFQPGVAGGDWVRQSKIYKVPNDPNVQLVLICMTDGKSGASWFDDLAVRVLDPAAASATIPAGTDLNAKVRISAAKIIRQIPRTLYGTNIEWRWNATLLWQEKEDRLDPNLVRLTRDLGLSLIRYPGGIYSDFYHWRDGVGPRNQRPIVTHEAGKPDKSRANFGTDEALDFARQTGSEVWISVNAADGTAQEAADWVRYVNGAKPQVRYWEVGNELYIKDFSDAAKAVTVDAKTYTDRYLAFSKAMREADPKIRLAAIGGKNHGRYAFVGYPDWLQTLLQRAGNEIDFLSIHNAYAPLVSEEKVPFEAVYEAMLGAPVLIKDRLQSVADDIAKYSPQRAGKIKLAITEWGPAFRFDLNSRWVDHVKTLGAGLFTASTLKAFIESPHTDVANFWMLHDFSALGAIGSTDTSFPPRPNWVPTPRYYAIQLFSKHFGSQLIGSNVDVPGFNTRAVGFTDAVEGVPYLDIVSSLSDDGNTLYIIGINKSSSQAVSASIELDAFVPQGKAQAWVLNGAGLDAHPGTGIIRAPGVRVPTQAQASVNPRYSKGNQSEITFSSNPVEIEGRAFRYSFPAHSATSLILQRRR